MARAACRNMTRKRRIEARRACTGVLAGLVLFAGLQLGLRVAIDVRLPEVRDPLYGRRLTRIRERQDAVSGARMVVMLGSSRTQCAFRVGADEERAWGESLGRPVAAFNFGVVAGGPLKELLTWHRLTRDGVRPDLLLVEVMPPLLARPDPLADFDAADLPVDRLAWRDLALVERYAGDRRPGLRGEWLRSWSAPWYSHRISILSRIQPALLPGVRRCDLEWNVDRSGAVQFMDQPVTPDVRLRATQHAWEEYQPSFAAFHLGEPGCAALRELLASCRREGVAVALVLMPEGPVFRSWYPAGAWQASKEWLRRLSREENASLIDAREWLDEDAFLDSHHLTVRGAAEFTRRLGRGHIVPLLRRPPTQARSDDEGMEVAPAKAPFSP